MGGLSLGINRKLDRRGVDARGVLAVDKWANGVGGPLPARQTGVVAATE